MKSSTHRVWSPAGRLFSPEFLIALFCLALVALLWVAVQTQDRFEYQQTVEAAFKQNSNLAIAFEQYAVRTIESADAITQVLRYEYARNGRSIDIHRLMAEHVIDTEMFSSVSIIDAHGKFVATNDETHAILPVNVAGREYFTVHIPRDTGRVYVSKPVQARIPNQQVVVITRRIETPRNGFGGIIAVTMEPSHFTRFLSAAILHPNDIIVLVGTDGITRARRVGPLESAGEDLRNGRLLQEEGRTPAGFYLGPLGNNFGSGHRDNIRRFFSYRHFRDYPLIAAVGATDVDVLRTFSEREFRYYYTAMMITALILTLGAVLISVRVRRKLDLVRLLDSEQRLKALFDHSSDVILLSNNAGRYIDANPAACSLLGYTREELLQVDPWQLNPADERATAQKNWTQLLALGRQSGEYHLQRKDGTLVEIECNAVANIEPGVHLSICRDITARKQAEEQVRRLNEQHIAQQRLMTHRFMMNLEEERRAISFELHDGLTQYVMSSFAFFDSTAASLNAEHIRVPTEMQKGLKYLQSAVVEARRMVNGLRSLALDELGLVGALEQLLVEERDRACWDEATLKVEGAIPRMDTVLETAAYRVVQEALTNIRKHAETKRAEVTLRLSEPADGSGRRLQMEVRDWGKGFTVLEKREEYDHVGLHSMEERVNLLNGSIQIESQPGQGTRVFAEFPIEHRITAPPHAPDGRKASEIVTF